MADEFKRPAPIALVEAQHERARATLAAAFGGSPPAATARGEVRQVRPMTACLHCDARDGVMHACPFSPPGSWTVTREHVVTAPAERVVTGCADCPLVAWDGDSAGTALCSRTEFRVIRPEADRLAGAPPRAPDWCPLRAAPVLVRLEKSP